MKQFLIYLARVQIIAAILVGFFAGIGVEQMFKGCP